MRQRRARKGFASHVSDWWSDRVPRASPPPATARRNPDDRVGVVTRMPIAKRSIGAPEWLVLVGGCVFIIVLFLSAVFEADIRWLHFFQAWLYIATIALTLRRNPWGYFTGISAAGLWDYASAFVNNFLASGVMHLHQWIQTGHLARPDQVIAVAAWLGNLMVVIGCAWAYRRHAEKRRGDLLRFVVAFVLATGFFAADMALFQPRYLSLFPRLLHPHLPHP
jgi:hypothetical protein